MTPEQSTLFGRQLKFYRAALAYSWDELALVLECDVRQARNWASGRHNRLAWVRAETLLARLEARMV